MHKKFLQQKNITDEGKQEDKNPILFPNKEVPKVKGGHGWRSLWCRNIGLMAMVN